MVPTTAAMAGGDSSLIFEEFLMPSNLSKYRHQSFLSQAHRCYYCGFLMWEHNPEQFAAIHKISLAQAQRFKCTAEHLEARKDGGADSRSNIVAACLYCNQTRHRIKPAPSPDKLRVQVAKQLQNNGWHKMKVALRLSNRIAT